VIVTRVHDANGSHIEPPLDQAWDDLTKLTWHAAVVTHETGLAIRVDQFERGSYGLAIGGTGLSERDFHSAWDYLNGVSTGATEAQRLIREEQPDPA
jgi:ABC-type Fe3+ transport system substrate-binding protein